MLFHSKCVEDIFLQIYKALLSKSFRFSLNRTENFFCILHTLSLVNQWSVISLDVKFLLKMFVVYGRQSIVKWRIAYKKCNLFPVVLSIVTSLHRAVQFKKKWNSEPYWEQILAKSLIKDNLVTFPFLLRQISSWQYIGHLYSLKHASIFASKDTALLVPFFR